MDKDWMPTNPYPREGYGGVDLPCCKLRFDEGVKAGQKKLMEYLLDNPYYYKTIPNKHGAQIIRVKTGIKPEFIECMLGELE